MDGDRSSSTPRRDSTAGVAARAILASSRQHGMRHAAGAARVGLALTRRPGHVVVTGPDGGVAEALVRATEAQLGAMRVVRGAAGDVEMDALLESVRRAAPDERVAVVVTKADRLNVASLERLHAGLDPAALTRGDVRLVLVGGPELLRTLQDARLGDLMARMCLHLDVPAVDEPPATGPADQAAPTAPAAARPSRIGPLELAGFAAVLVVGVVLWTRLDAGPRRSPPRPSVVATPRPVDTGPTATAPAPTEPIPDTPSDAAPPVIDTPPPVVAAPVAAAPLASAPVAAAKPRVDTEAARPAPAVPGASLQVGAFASAANAARLAARLRPRFGRVEVTKTVRGSKTLHRVRIVGFASEADRRRAERLLAVEGLASVRVR